MIEIWKDIQEYNGVYQISNLGRVKSTDRTVIMKNNNLRNIKGKLVKGGIYPNGYKFVCLRKNNTNKNIMIHRLVANEFIENKNNYNVVNHKDGIKSNNHIDNLEWCTQSHNLKHAVKTGLMKSQCKIQRQVTVITPDLNTILFENMKKCAEYFGFKKSWVNNRIRKYGFEFKFRDHLVKVDVKRGDA